MRSRSDRRIAAEDLPRVEGVPAESYAALAGRYGYAAREVLALAPMVDGISNGQRGELAQPIVPGLPDLLAEVALAARREQARSIGDVLLRRTRLGLLAARELPVERVGRRARAGAGLETRAHRARGRRCSRRRPTPRGFARMRCRARAGATAPSTEPVDARRRRIPR